MSEWLEQLEARRKAREATARTIEVDGVTLTLKPALAPQIPVRYTQAHLALIAHSVAAAEARAAGKDEPGFPPELHDDALVDLMDELVTAALHPSSLAAWKALRDPGRAHPWGFNDLWQLTRGIMSEASGFPTEGPADSSDGPQSTETSSKAGSSSKAGTRKR